MRFNPNYKTGLTTEQVNIQKEKNLVNYDTDIKTKTIPQIISENIFTLFNLLNSLILLAIILVGSYKNALFFGVVICNTIISTFHELNSKRIIDKLSVVTLTKVDVVRNGRIEKKDLNEIVLDDVILLNPGNQVITDAIVINGECEVNESFITGEAKNVFKKEKDMILSGSFIVSGQVYAKVEHIGDENYTAKITKEAKYIKKNNSVLIKSLNKIIKFVSFIIIPIGIIFFLKQQSLPGSTIENSVISTCAALIGMIPEGLILLTSTVLAISIIKLSKYNVLVQDLYCIETLARVDMICLDKTGTLTEGNLKIEKVIPLDNNENINKILGNFTYHIKDENATIKAIRDKYYLEDKKKVSTIPFSSAYKYSAVIYDDITYVLGAPNFIYDKELEELEKYDDYRVVLLGKTSKIKDKKIDRLKPIALIVLSDKIRDEAKNTLEYFKKEGVKVKIISGDNAKSVNTIAKKVGLDNINYINVTDIDENKLLKNIDHYNIFGRVTPDLKKRIILKLKEVGYTVGMVGDGINDILALKEADCSVALASGTDATKSVSQLVLLDSNFDSMPHIVHEGRRTVNNITRSASLFLMKTFYTIFLVLIYMLLPLKYPFMPIQLTLTSMVTIGIPGFILSLEPNKEKIKGNFLVKVFTNAIPPAIVIVINILMIILLDDIFVINTNEFTTIAVILNAFVGFLVLYLLCQPFNKIRIILLTSMVLLFLGQAIFLKELFSLASLNLNMIILLLILMILDIMLFYIFTNYLKDRINKRFN